MSGPAAFDNTGLFPFQKGRYRAEAGDGVRDAALALRALCFRGQGQDDRDRYDAQCLHVILRDLQSDHVVCCFRLLLLPAADIEHSYSAQFYDLTPLAQLTAPVMELGRFSLHPDWHDPDILRLAWAAMTRIVDARGVGVLFGCASFAGVLAAKHSHALRWLAARHLGPEALRPRIRSPLAFDYRQAFADQTPDLRRATAQMPPLLRSYLAMGGWVSDHAVVDRDLNTLHVFTGLEIGAIPAARARLLRAIAE